MKPYTIRDWYKYHRPSAWSKFRYRWLNITREYRELGWKYFGWRPWRMFKASGFFPELWYYLKCRLWRRYNVIHVRSLPPTWTDRSEAMIHVMFQVLVDVVEKEDWFNDRVYFMEDEDNGPDFVWDFRDEWQEMAILYDWWVNKRPARLKAEEEASSAWHKAFEAAGGMQFGPVEKIGTEGAGVREMIFSHSPTEQKLFEHRNDMEKWGEADDEQHMHRLVMMVPYFWT